MDSALKVKLSSLVREVQKRIEAITALLADNSPPDLVLNRHCSQCEFRARCYKQATEKDELSLLSGMSEKERKKLRGKGHIHCDPALIHISSASTPPAIAK